PRVPSPLFRLTLTHCPPVAMARSCMPSLLKSPTAMSYAYPGGIVPLMWKLMLGVSRVSSRSMVGRSGARRRLRGDTPRVLRTLVVFRIDDHHMIAPPLVCEKMAAACSGAQTERQGGTGPAGGLLGGKTPRAAPWVTRTQTSLADEAIHCFCLGKNSPLT